MGDPLDLVVCSLEPWDQVWRRNQHLVAGMLRRDPELRVLFVEPSADPMHTMSRRGLPRLARGLQPLNNETGIGAGRLWAFQPTKWLPRSIDRRADERLARAAARAASKVGFRAPRLWINDPSAIALLEMTSWPSVYDITDDWLAADRSEREHGRLVSNESELMRSCDAVVVCSPWLAQRKGAIRDVVLIPNAVDVSAYGRPHARPGMLPPGRTALYVGTLHRDRIDVALCVNVANRLRASAGGTAVFIGPNALDYEDRSALAGAGAVMLGAQPSEAIPAYLQHGNVLMVPHVVTDFTASLDPIKLYEYQAAGRPVVSTPVAGFADVDHPAIRIVDPADFPAEVERRISTPISHRPDAATSVPDWSSRVTDMAQVIASLPR